MRNLFLLLLFFLSIKTVYSQYEGDRIAAIVGHSIITEFELRSQTLEYARQNNLQPTNELARLILENLIDNKLIYEKAIQDSLFLSESDLNTQVNNRYNDLVLEYGSEKNLQELTGLTSTRLKELLRKNFREQMLVDQYKRQKFGYGITITRREVQDFFRNFRDSIPNIPESYELYAIARKPEVTADIKRDAYNKISLIRDSLKIGMDFNELARRNSDDSLSALAGGYLGKAKKGTFVKEFEEVAFTLKEGEVSNIVETQYGYHLIKLNKKTGDIIEASHILVRFPYSLSSDNESIRFLRDLKANIKSLDEFKKAAFLNSHDIKTAADSGYVGKISLYQLDTLQMLALKELSPGQISEPVRYGDNVNYYYTIFYLVTKFPEHAATLDGDYKIIENIARNNKETKLLNEWLKEIKKSIYIERKISL